MLEFVLLVFTFGAITCEPETVRDNFDYFNYGANEEVLKNLDLHLVKKTPVCYATMKSFHLGGKKSIDLASFSAKRRNSAATSRTKGLASTGPERWPDHCSFSQLSGPACYLSSC